MTQLHGYFWYTGKQTISTECLSSCRDLVCPKHYQSSSASRSKTATVRISNATTTIHKHVANGKHFCVTDFRYKSLAWCLQCLCCRGIQTRKLEFTWWKRWQRVRMERNQSRGSRCGCGVIEFQVNLQFVLNWPCSCKHRHTHTHKRRWTYIRTLDTCFLLSCGAQVIVIVLLLN